MKENIDLTMNNDFGTVVPIRYSRKTQHYFSNIVDGVSYNRDFHISEDIYDIDKGAIYQGNKLTRLSKKLAAGFGDTLTCDRCGSLVYPYDNDTLCKYCRKDMWYDFQKSQISWLNNRR